jgi:hypothetical protein
MTTPAPQPSQDRSTAYEDAAWVEIPTALSVVDLLSFLDDIERLYRINPLLEIRTFEVTGGGTYRLAARNLSNGRDIETALAVTRRETGIDVRYSHGLKTATSFRAKPAAGEGGSHLIVTDVYEGGTEAERRARAGEVDLSLNAWGRALHDYLRAWTRWSWLAPWRWYMRRTWQPMTPSARRIVWMIWVVSAFEVAALAALLAIWLSLRWLA